MKLLFAILILSVFAGCVRKSTNDPIQVYENWSGDKPPKEVYVIHGKYDCNSKWTKEYTTYLELKAPPSWCSQMIEQYNLLPGTEYTVPEDAPSWFRPEKNYKVWKPSGFDQSSFYLEDPVTGHFFIYEIHL